MHFLNLIILCFPYQPSSRIQFDNVIAFSVFNASSRFIFENVLGLKESIE